MFQSPKQLCAFYNDLESLLRQVLSNSVRNNFYKFGFVLLKNVLDKFSDMICRCFTFDQQ